METTIEKEDLELKDMGYFTGTEAYHNIWLNVLGTDGIAYVMKNGYSWAVTDACAVLRKEEKVRNEEFVAVKLQLPGDGTAKMVYENGDEKVLFTQKYGFTSARREFIMYYTDGILLLSGEY